MSVCDDNPTMPDEPGVEDMPDVKSLKIKTTVSIISKIFSLHSPTVNDNMVGPMAIIALF